MARREGRGGIRILVGSLFDPERIISGQLALELEGSDYKYEFDYEEDDRQIEPNVSGRFVKAEYRYCTALKPKRSQFLKL